MNVQLSWLDPPLPLSPCSLLSSSGWLFSYDRMTQNDPLLFELLALKIPLHFAYTSPPTDSAPKQPQCFQIFASPREILHNKIRLHSHQQRSIFIQHIHPRPLCRDDISILRHLEPIRYKLLSKVDGPFIQKRDAFIAESECVDGSFAGGVERRALRANGSFDRAGYCTTVPDIEGFARG